MRVNSMRIHYALSNGYVIDRILKSGERIGDVIDDLVDIYVKHKCDMPDTVYISKDCYGRFGLSNQMLYCYASMGRLDVKLHDESSTPLVVGNKEEFDNASFYTMFESMVLGMGE